MKDSSENRLERYPSFDGLRAYSAIGIVMMHVLLNLKSFDTDTLAGSPWLFRTFLPSLGGLVFLFMMVSAFSMCCGYYERFRNRAIDLNDFYRKRYARVLPFFALLVLIDVLLNPSLAALYEGFADVTLVFGLLPDANISVIGVGWFLGTIFVFYMLFPFFVFLLNGKGRAWLAFAVSIAMHFLATGYFSKNHPAGSYNIVYSAPFFFAGGLIYLYRDLLKGWKGMRVLAPVAAIALSVLIYVLPELPLISKLLVFASWTVVAVVLMDRKSLLNDKFVHFISGISMEVYLCHMLFFRLVEKCRLESFIPNPYVQYVLYLFLTLAGAIVFSWVIKYKVFPLLPFLKPKES